MVHHCRTTLWVVFSFLLNLFLGKTIPIDGRSYFWKGFKPPATYSKTILKTLENQPKTLKTHQNLTKNPPKPPKNAPKTWPTKTQQLKNHRQKAPGGPRRSLAPGGLDRCSALGGLGLGEVGGATAEGGWKDGARSS